MVDGQARPKPGKERPKGAGDVKQKRKKEKGKKSKLTVLPRYTRRLVVPNPANHGIATVQPIKDIVPRVPLGSFLGLGDERRTQGLYRLGAQGPSRDRSPQDVGGETLSAAGETPSAVPYVRRERTPLLCRRVDRVVARFLPSRTAHGEGPKGRPELLKMSDAMLVLDLCL